jgi:hypothetical protein
MRTGLNTRTSNINATAGMGALLSENSGKHFATRLRNLSALIMQTRVPNVEVSNGQRSDIVQVLCQDPGFQMGVC